MKELVSALSQATANRLKAPILGAFILAWLAWNHIYVIEFFFSESKDKITFVKSLEFHLLSDLVIPAVIAVLYTFGLPWLQHQVDKLKYSFIDDKRIRAKHSRDKSKYESLGGTARAQAECSLEYQKEKLGRDLDLWAEQRNILKGKITTLNDEIAHQTQLRQDAEIATSNLQSQLDFSNETQQSQGEELKSLKAELEDLQENKENLESHYIELRRQTRNFKGILELIAQLDIDETKSLRDHYLDNPNFRALAHAKDINSPEYTNELVKNDHVVKAVLDNLFSRNDDKLNEILSKMGYVYSPNLSSPQISISRGEPRLPLDDVYQLKG
ncbi:hypothetical protein [Vibrio sp. 10N.261.51.C6]|uniref:hypothetical protein n=1 Tax=Vibrio sp. 10N.261.51.C6 TaxID=3229676 RepID=UPI0035531990